jgi:predicted RNase H-like nuclease (RuvC/YqgF family)
MKDDIQRLERDINSVQFEMYKMKADLGRLESKLDKVIGSIDGRVDKLVASVNCRLDIQDQNIEKTVKELELQKQKLDMWMKQ